ncbi:SHOCT domain-containing protein [bacterium]|nr:MAG: SHOCT domain-containing protein [bacterium]
MMGGFGWLFVVLVAVVVVAAVLVLYRRSDDYRNRQIRGSSPLDILDERYARGEIDGDEYKKRRADLERRSGGQS